MARIRGAVRADVEAHRDERGPLRRYAADPESGTAPRSGAVLHSEELRYLNTNYAYPTRLNLDGITSHRPGLIGRLIVSFKRRVIRILWDSLFKEYFSAEREYQANLVRFLNDMARYVDGRDTANFWELIRKIDYEIARAMERIERINDEQMASIRTSERTVFDALEGSLGDLRQGLAELRSTAHRHDDQLAVMDSVTRGLEGIAARLREGGEALPAAAAAPASGPVADFSYLLLENRFRGSEAEIAHRLEIYPPIFTGAARPVVEIGGGRGELQGLFRAAGVTSYSVDLDPAMVQAAIANGADARLGDGLAHLRSLSDGSIGGVIAVQVVEHLTRAQLEELMRLCRTKVAPGGRVVFETINPRSVLALSSNYFRDPTHVWPLHPDTLSYTMTLAGLNVLEVRLLSPVPAEAQLREIPREPFMSPRWEHTVETFNRNIRQLNDLLYGAQDYCVVAEVR